MATKKSPKNGKEILQGIYKKINDNVLISSLLPLIGLLANIFGVFGVYLKEIEIFSFLYDADGLKPISIAIISFIFIISCCILLIQYIGDKFTRKSKQIEEDLYEKITNMERCIKNDIHDKIKVAIVQEGKYKNYYNFTRSPLSDPSSRLNPVTKIDCIFDHATGLLAERFGCSKSEVSMCLIYKSEKQSKWIIMNRKNLSDSELDLEYLMSHRESTFNSVLKTSGKFEFFTDKNVAYDQGKYVKSSSEFNRQLEGSIYCKNLSIYDDDNNLVKGFALSIGTKKVAFCDDLDEFSSNICKKMFKIIEDYIKGELIVLHAIEYMGLGEILK